MKVLIKAVVGVIGGYFFLSNAASAANEFGTGHTSEYDEFFLKYAEQYLPQGFGFDKHSYAKLLKAIAIRESGLDPKATRTEGWTVTIVDEDGSHEVNPISFGLMQILIPQSLNVEGWPENPPDDPKSDWTMERYGEMKEKLKDPEFNIKIGAQILQWNIEHGGDAPHGVQKGVALYNAWNNDNREAPATGPFTNQHYVDDVLELFSAISIGG